MNYSVHPQLKYLSANLKRLKMGHVFSTKEFQLVLEENNLDDYWKKANEIRLRNSSRNLPINIDEIHEKFANNFIIGLDLILREYYLNKMTFQNASLYFTRFFDTCFSFFLANEPKMKDFSKIILALEQYDFLDKKVFIKIKNLIEQKEKDFLEDKLEIVDSKLPKEYNLTQEKKYQIFISSTYIDLKKERQAAVEAILRKGHIPAGMELFSAGDKSQWEIIKKWIDDSDIYLLILGGRYGSIDKTTGLSYTEMEYNYAIEKKKPFFALSLSDEILNNKSVEIIRDYDLKNTKYISFKERVTKNMCSFPKNIDQIKIEINHSLDNLILEHINNLKGWIKGNI